MTGRYPIILDHSSGQKKEMPPGDAVPLDAGGTGATDAAGARDNLDVYSKPEVDALTPRQAGFGFWNEGLYAGREHLGAAVWVSDVVFTASEPKSFLLAELGFAATADAVFTLLNHALTQVGTMTVAAGGRTGALAFTADPYTHPANTPLHIYSPDPADPTLGNVNAVIVGALA